MRYFLADQEPLCHELGNLISTFSSPAWHVLAMWVHTDEFSSLIPSLFSNENLILIIDDKEENRKQVRTPLFPLPIATADMGN